ncbi:phytoene desaturase [Xanthobacter agilis]|uniref:Phytoene dehydrogenase n=1 Tax=Xanthobacter agilis TaxID=47492 RepID=A0ABU0LHG3_XANAG|nr:phytoene desaturase [Xanthobacter agilis]MDQ0506589.1 phytoene desaturase [Xanthobacter agilis]
MMLDAIRPPRTAAVIGAGFGGLALAIRLQAAGLATTLYEKRDKPGGRAYVYEDRGFTFDGGPTVITDPTCLEDVFEAAGRRLADYVELMPVSPFYRLMWRDGRAFDYVNDQDALDAQIRRFAPQDVEGYRRFLAYSQEVFEEGYLKLGAVPFLHFSDMIKAAPQLLRLQAWRSVYSMVARFICEPHLRQAFSFHSLLVGGNPFATSSIYALIHALERKWGVFFPRGGTGALVKAMVRLFEELGGQVRLSTPVDEVEVEEGRACAVRLKGGERVPCDLVASNADVVHTYGTLLRNTARGRQEGARLAGKRHSMSLFVTYFGARRTWSNLAQHTVLFGPRYRGLVRDIFRGPGLAADFSLYVHAPSVTDPSLAPAGCTAFYVLSPVPHLGKAPLDWGRIGPLYRDRILAHLEQRLLPGLRESLVTTRMLTPFGFRDELNAHHGSAFSIEPILTQSAWFRPHNRDDRIPNLYFTGAGTHPGAGVPGVVGSAKATAGLILADLAADGASRP